MRNSSCNFARCPEGFGVLAVIAGRPVSLLWHCGARGFRAERSPDPIGTGRSLIDLTAGPVALSFTI